MAEVGGEPEASVKINMARIRIFVAKVRTQHRAKTKLSEKQTRRQ